MSGKRILVVEDNEMIRVAMEEGIKKLKPDYQVVAVIDGVTALAALYKQSFDLMITDYNIPGMTGMDLVSKVQQILPDMRIVMMSAQDIIEIRIEARQRHLNLDGYLQKPFALAQVGAVIKHVESQKV